MEKASTEMRNTVTIPVSEYTALCLSAEVLPVAEAPQRLEFDHPFELVNVDNKWFVLRAHGVAIASYSISAWGSASACIEAAWRRAYSDPEPVSLGAPESFVLTEEFCGSVKDLAAKGFTKERIDRLWKALHEAAVFSEAT